MLFKLLFNFLLAYLGIINEGDVPVCSILDGSLSIIIKPASFTKRLIEKLLILVELFPLE